MKSSTLSVSARDAAKSKHIGTESVSNGRDRGSYDSPWAKQRSEPQHAGDDDGHEGTCRQDTALFTPAEHWATSKTDHHTGTTSTDTILTRSGGLDGRAMVADLYATEAGRWIRRQPLR